MATKVLFLGYGESRTRLIDLTRRLGGIVDVVDTIVGDLSGHDITISFGYRHILKPAVLATARRPVLNLHISQLPWNRGAHPLFWAAYDGTPAGVTIHELDSGIDTGPVCFQRVMELDYHSETFISAHAKLIDDVEALFEEHAAEILSGNYVSVPQNSFGTFKRARDLPAGFSWSEKIAPTIARLKKVVGT